MVGNKRSFSEMSGGDGDENGNEHQPKRSNTGANDKKQQQQQQHQNIPSANAASGEGVWMPGAVGGHVPVSGEDSGLPDDDSGEPETSGLANKKNQKTKGKSIGKKKTRNSVGNRDYTAEAQERNKNRKRASQACTYCSGTKGTKGGCRLLPNGPCTNCAVDGKECKMLNKDTGEIESRGRYPRKLDVVDLYIDHHKRGRVIENQRDQLAWYRHHTGLNCPTSDSQESEGSMQTSQTHASQAPNMNTYNPQSHNNNTFAGNTAVSRLPHVPNNAPPENPHQAAFYPQFAQHSYQGSLAPQNPTMAQLSNYLRGLLGNIPHFTGTFNQVPCVGFSLENLLALLQPTGNFHANVQGQNPQSQPVPQQNYVLAHGQVNLAQNAPMQFQHSHMVHPSVPRTTAQGDHAQAANSHQGMNFSPTTQPPNPPAMASGTHNPYQSIAAQGQGAQPRHAATFNAPAMTVPSQGTHPYPHMNAHNKGMPVLLQNLQYHHVQPATPQHPGNPSGQAPSARRQGMGMQEDPEVECVGSSTAPSQPQCNRQIKCDNAQQRQDTRKSRYVLQHPGLPRHNDDPQPRYRNECEQRQLEERLQRLQQEQKEHRQRWEQRRRQQQEELQRQQRQEEETQSQQSQSSPQQPPQTNSQPQPTQSQSTSELSQGTASQSVESGNTNTQNNNPSNLPAIDPSEFSPATNETETTGNGNDTIVSQQDAAGFDAYLNGILGEMTTQTESWYPKMYTAAATDDINTQLLRGQWHQESNNPDGLDAQDQFIHDILQQYTGGSSQEATTTQNQSQSQQQIHGNNNTNHEYGNLDLPNTDGFDYLFGSFDQSQFPMNDEAWAAVFGNGPETESGQGQ